MQGRHLVCIPVQTPDKLTHRSVCSLFGLLAGFLRDKTCALLKAYVHYWRPAQATGSCRCLLTCISVYSSTGVVVLRSHARAHIVSFKLLSLCYSSAMFPLALAPTVFVANLVFLKRYQSGILTSDFLMESLYYHDL
jgi:hypothetical protein